MNMARKKSKRSTKGITHQNSSGTPSGNADIASESSQSTSTNVASSDASQSISSHSTSRYASSELKHDNEHTTAPTIPRRRNSKSNRPSLNVQEISEDTFRNSTTAISVTCISSQCTISSNSTTNRGNRRRSSEKSASVALHSTAGGTASAWASRVGSSQSTVRSIAAADAAQVISLQSKAKGTTSAGASQVRSFQSTARSTAFTGVIQSRSLQSITRTNTSTQAPTRINRSTLAPIRINGSAEAPVRINRRTEAPIRINRSAEAPMRINRSTQAPTRTNRSTQSAAVPLDDQRRIIETHSRGLTCVDNAAAQREVLLPTSRNSSSVTIQQGSQTTQSNTNNVERRDSILYPKFFVIRTLDGSELNIIEVENHLGLIGCITLLRDGSLLIKTNSQAENEAISSLTTICNKRVAIVSHRGLNSSQGTIFCKNLNGCSVEEILDHLRLQHVTKVYRFRKKVNGVLVDTPRILLTFNTPLPPKRIKAGFLLLEVRVFSPTPRRCYNCQSFKHVIKYCTSPPVCPLCGETGHTYPPRCNNPIRCVNCGENGHPANSSECGVFKREKKVLELHALKKIGIAAARSRIARKT